ncbi:MAG: enoyl-CoA hydratase [Burkholderiaceae bacterium]|nr:enoyl-CoA hydratase [Burkholderiaceae bacterium]
MTTTRLLQGEITDSLIIEKRGAVGWITFNDPAKHNAMSYDMWAALPGIIKMFENDEEIRAVVLTGAGGKSFVSGANISQFEKLRTAADAVAEYERVGEEAQGSIYNCTKPVIGRIDGYCIGGGLNLSLCCDIRIASDASSFAIPAGRLGLGYRLTAIRNLVSTVGAPQALDIMLSAQRFTAQEAKAKGLIQHLVPVAELDKAVDDYLAKVVANAPITLRAGKKAIREFQKVPPHVDVEGIKQMVLACFASDDYQEGKRAFAEKRTPVFRNK